MFTVRFFPRSTNSSMVLMGLFLPTKMVISSAVKMLRK